MRTRPRKSNVRKCLPETRTAINAADGWDKLKDKAALDALIDKGDLPDLWLARAYRSIPVGKADASQVFEYRNFDRCKKPFDANWGARKCCRTSSATRPGTAARSR